MTLFEWTFHKLFFFLTFLTPRAPSTIIICTHVLFIPQGYELLKVKGWLLSVLESVEPLAQCLEQNMSNFLNWLFAFSQNWPTILQNWLNLFIILTLHASSFSLYKYLTCNVLGSLSEMQRSEVYTTENL